MAEGRTCGRPRGDGWLALCVRPLVTAPLLHGMGCKFNLLYERVKSEGGKKKKKEKIPQEKPIKGGK